MPAAERWVKWVEPYGPNNEPVYMRVSESTAIAVARKRWGRPKVEGWIYTDGHALADFIAVHWATITEGEQCPTKTL